MATHFGPGLKKKQNTIIRLRVVNQAVNRSVQHVWNLQDTSISKQNASTARGFFTCLICPIIWLSCLLGKEMNPKSVHPKVHERSFLANFIGFCHHFWYFFGREPSPWLSRKPAHQFTIEGSWTVKPAVRKNGIQIRGCCLRWMLGS